MKLTEQSTEKNTMVGLFQAIYHECKELTVCEAGEIVSHMLFLEIDFHLGCADDKIPWISISKYVNSLEFDVLCTDVVVQFYGGPDEKTVYTGNFSMLLCQVIISDFISTGGHKALHHLGLLDCIPTSKV